MTSTELQTRILRLFPDFRHFWDAEGNLPEKERTPLSCSEVFATFSRYFKVDCQNWSPTALDDISTLLEDSLMSSRSESATGAKSFIESLVGDMAESCLSDYLGPKARTYHLLISGEKIKKSELISKFSKILLGKRP